MSDCEGCKKLQWQYDELKRWADKDIAALKRECAELKARLIEGDTMVSGIEKQLREQKLGKAFDHLHKLARLANDPKPQGEE